MVLDALIREFNGHVAFRRASRRGVLYSFQIAE